MGRDFADPVLRLLDTTTRDRGPMAIDCGRQGGRQVMTKNGDNSRKTAKLQDKKARRRREFFSRGAAAGVGATVLSAGAANAQSIQWNYEADVVVLGSG